ncbi:hypothetical protein IAU60_002086 [Kwoniella sp. DSM 27419]
MLTIRGARQSALRLARSTLQHSTAPALLREGEWSLPHAESSSAPFRRLITSSAPAGDNEASGAETTHSTRAKGGEKSKANSRIRRQALANAKRLAEAFQTEQDGKGTPSPPTPTAASRDTPEPVVDTQKAFWSEMLVQPKTDKPASADSSSTSAPTLDDLLVKRPNREPPEPWHPSYAKMHKRIYNNIDSAFVISQMRGFAKELNIGISGRTRNVKGLIIKKIMKSWGWVEPRAKPVERPALPTVFDLPPPELFLFLRDNELIQSFTQGAEPLEFSVVSYDQARHLDTVHKLDGDPGRMVLLASGKDAAVAALATALKERQEAIKTTQFSAADVHGLQASAATLQTVSNAAGAYVEPVDEGSYCVTAMSDEDVKAAKRLLCLAALRTTILPSTRQHMTLLPAVPHFLASAPPSHKFALYPFTPSLTEPLQWDQAAKLASHSLFRLKKVEQWASKPGTREVDHRSEKVQDAPVYYPAATKESTLRELVTGLQVEPGTKSQLKVQFGHLLLAVPAKDGGLATWSPPLSGQVSIDTAHKWLAAERGRKPTFAPCLTPAVIQFPLSGSPRQTRRLRYRTLPAASLSPKYVSFTHTQAMSGPDAVNSSVDSQQEQPQEMRWQDQLGELLDKMEKEMEEEAPRNGETEASAGLDAEYENPTAESPGAEPDATATVPVVGFQANDIPGEVVIEAERGTLKELDMFIPARPCDARLTSYTTSVMSAEQVPEEIKAVFQAHVSRQAIHAPSYLEIDGERFELELDESAEITEEVTGGVTKRTVRSIDEGLEGHIRPMIYTEIEWAEPNVQSEAPTQFWKELSMISRDIGPDASALSVSAGIMASMQGWAGNAT